MKKFLLALTLSMAIAGCASPPAQTVGGNGSCHPSQDLAAHKIMKKVPEADTQLEDLYALLANERKDHAVDIRDYNSLYNQCVDKTVSPVSPVSPK